MELAQQQAQKQVLSQGLRRSLEVLQLPQTELEGYLQEAVLSNPLLEMELPQDLHLPDPEGEPARALAEREADTWEASDSESAAVWDLPADSAWEGSAGEGFQELEGVSGRVFDMTVTLDPAACQNLEIRLGVEGRFYTSLQYLGQQGIAIRYTGGLVRITCGTPEENRAVLQEMAAYFAATPAEGE